MNSPNRQFIIGAVWFALTIIVGTEVYYMAGWTFLEAIYMVVITIFGVGYGEVRELSPELRWFTLFLILTGCTCLIYVLGAFINWLTEGQLQNLLGKHKMEKDISQLSGHTVICGYGRVGRILATQLKEAGKEFVIIEKPGQQIEMLREAGCLFVEGDATEEWILKKARIEHATTVATVIPNDAVNVFIVLSCRAINRKLMIIARANQTSTEEKLNQAGADRVVLPAAIGADRIAQLIIRPNAQDILEKDLKDNAFIGGLSEIGVEITEFYIEEGAPIIGSTLMDLETACKSAFMVIAVRKPSGHSIVKPTLFLELEAQDTLIVMTHQGFVPEFVRGTVKRKQITYRGQKL